MLKKCLIVVLTVVMCFSVFVVTATAAGITTCDISSASKTSSLTLSGTTATCTSFYNDCQTASKIVIVQSLEKKSFLWSWNTVGGEWTKTVTNSANVAFSNKKTSLSSGTYRVKSVFTVTLSDGASETVTRYSSEVKI